MTDEEILAGATNDEQREHERAILTGPRRHGDPTWHLHFLDVLKRDFPRTYDAITGKAIAENALRLTAACPTCANKRSPAARVACTDPFHKEIQ